MEEMERWWAAMSDVVGPYLPRLAGALLIAAAAWLGASLARRALARLAQRAGLEARLHSPGLGESLGTIAYGLVWLLALPALLGTLQLQGLLDPVNAMLSRLMAFVPSLIGALAVLAIGVLIARIVRQIVAGMLRAAGSERLAGRLGLTPSLGDDGLAGVLANVVFVLVLLPTLVAALQPLGLDALTQPLSRLLDTVLALIPRLVSALVIVGLGALLGRMLAALASATLAAAGLDRLPGRLDLGAEWRVAGRTPSELSGLAVMIAAVLAAITQACEILGLPVLTGMVATIGAGLAQVAIALVVLAAGAALAALAARAVEASTVVNGRALGHVVRGAILFFSAALALRQAGLPAEIVTIAFGALVGGVAIGLAVAVGAGGRHVAGRLLEDAVAALGRRPDAGNTPEG